jgi:hypothetical protein
MKCLVAALALCASSAFADPFTITITLDNLVQPGIEAPLEPMALHAQLQLDDLDGDGVVTPAECLSAFIWDGLAATVTHLQYRVADGELDSFFARANPEDGISYYMGMTSASIVTKPLSWNWEVAGDGRAFAQAAVPVPEPSTWVMLLAGLITLSVAARRPGATA